MSADQKPARMAPMTPIAKLFSCLLLFVISCHLLRPGAYAQAAKYDIKAARVSMADLNSAEQTLAQVYSSNSPYHFRITIVSTNYQIPTYNPLKRSYGREIVPFLAATSKIMTKDVNLATTSEQLWSPDGNVGVYLTNSLRWVSTNIVFDHELATKIGTGESDTRPSADVLALHKGTCSEYANLFIALMRYRNIPAAYISGWYFNSSYHAWAEVYLEGVGWVSVDPQGGSVGISTRHIKLFRGVDFPTIQTKLSEIKIKATTLPE